MHIAIANEYELGGVGENVKRDEVITGGSNCVYLVLEDAAQM